MNLIQHTVTSLPFIGLYTSKQPQRQKKKKQVTAPSPPPQYKPLSGLYWKEFDFLRRFEA